METKLAGKAQFVEHLFGPGRYLDFRLEIDGARHYGLAAYDKLQNVFDTAVLGNRIERDGLPILARQMNHAAAANEFGAQKSRVDRVEDRVAVRAIDHRMERRFQMNRIAAAFSPKSGVSVWPSTSICWSTPPYLPVEDKIPLMP